MANCEDYVKDLILSHATEFLQISRTIGYEIDKLLYAHEDTGTMDVSYHRRKNHYQDIDDLEDMITAINEDPDLTENVERRDRLISNMSQLFSRSREHVCRNPRKQMEQNYADLMDEYVEKRHLAVYATLEKAAAIIDRVPEHDRVIKDRLRQLFHNYGDGLYREFWNVRKTNAILARPTALDKAPIRTIIPEWTKEWDTVKDIRDPKLMTTHFYTIRKRLEYTLEIVSRLLESDEYFPFLVPGAHIRAMRSVTTGYDTPKVKFIIAATGITGYPEEQVVYYRGSYIADKDKVSAWYYPKAVCASNDLMNEVMEDLAESLRSTVYLGPNFEGTPIYVH